MSHDVHFVTAGRTASAQDGEVLLDVARRAGVHIDSTCGGNGSCHQCRVILDQPANFRDQDGNPVPARHMQGDTPVFLACRGRVYGELRVTPAPVHAVAARDRNSGLIGWHVEGAGPLNVLDLGSRTGALYALDADGAFVREQVFSIADGDDIPDAKALRVGRDVPRAEALARGVEHLGVRRVLVFDLAGFVAVVEDGTARLEPVPTMALLGEVPHVAGAIEGVEWSPLKTRTILRTVADAPPTGLCASGVLACVAAIRHAGMCDADWQLVESRFTRAVAGGLEALLVGPATEAVTPGGAILTSESDIVFTQAQLDAARGALEGLRVMARHLCDGRDPDAVVLTGEHGTNASPEVLEALELWHTPIKPQPHLAALGTARTNQS